MKTLLLITAVILAFISSVGYVLPATLNRDKKGIDHLPRYTIYPNKKAGIIDTPTFGTPDSARVVYFPNGF